MKPYSQLLASALGFLFAIATVRTAEEIDIDRLGGGVKTIPISLSGFTGDVESVLKFDLEICGFTVVAPEKAQYLISGSNGASLVGRVVDRVSKAQVLGQEYRGAAARTLAHTFSDDIVEKLAGVKGIARTKIAFKGDFGKTSEIYVADYDGFGARAVTADQTIVAAPHWGPGRKVLCYTSYLKDNPDVYAYYPATGDRRILARYSGLNTSPSVSPDGTRVALICSKDGSPDVYVCDIDGKNLRRVTKTKESESSPCWSPDGRTLCFSSQVGGRAALYKVSAEGGEMRRISTIGVGGNLTEPDWSPDGKWILFTSQTGGFDLCVVPSQGGEAKVLVSGEDPSWSANSRTAIFTRRVGGGKRVLSLLDVPTKRVKDIGRISGSSSQPSWGR